MSDIPKNLFHRSSGGKKGEDPSQAEAKVPAVWKIGDVILDLYEVKQVHEGGMGLVYRVHHRGWNMDLAAKSPRIDLFKTLQQKDNFIRECETWINLGMHPHIVSCYYVRTLGGIPRIFAEYVEGGSLKDWIESRRLYEGGPKKSLERILDIVIQMAWGLQYAHEKGLVHQDVKPGNVLVNTGGTVKVTDFGLAKARALAGETTKPSGDQTIFVTSGGRTPAYCSPEQANGKPLSRRTDIWSWAISVFEMFVGEPPCRYGGQLAAEVFASYLEEGSGDESLPPMPPSLARVLTDSFKRDPAQRPREIRSVAKRITAIYEDIFQKTYPRAEPKAVELLADQINNRAISLRDLGAYAEADQMLEEALRTYPRHLPLVFNHGILGWRSGKSTDSALLTELRTIRETQTSDWLPAYAEGLAHLERWDIESAITLLETSVTLGGDRDVIATLGRAVAMSPESARCLGSFEGHASVASSVILAPDERSFLSGSYDHTLRLWDVAAQRCIRTFEGHAGPVTSVSISGDGKWAISSSQDNTLRMWDIQTARCVRIFEVPMSPPVAVSLSPDSRRAVSAGGAIDGPGDFLVRLWDTSTGLVLSALPGHERAVLSVCFSSEGQWILSGGWDNTIRLWNTATGRCEQIFRGHLMAVTSVALSRDTRFAVSGSMDSTMRLWETKTGLCLRVFPHPSYVYSVSLDKSDRFALSGCWDGRVRLWNLPTSRCLRTFGFDNPKLRYVVSTSLGAACRYAVSGHSDKTLRLWNVAALCR
ncbi:MAG: protein kinase, partial [Planctomycetota bacterium]